MNINDKVYYYSYSNRDNTGIIGSENTFTAKVYDILGVNEENIVINDRGFSTLAIKKAASYETQVNKQECHFYLGDRCFGSGLRFYIYSSKPISTKRIKSMISKHVEKKLQFLGSIDLSVITEKEELSA